MQKCVACRALARKSSSTEIMHISAIVHLISVVTSCVYVQYISNLSAQGYTLYMYNVPHDLFCICVCVCFIRNCLGVRTQP